MIYQREPGVLSTEVGYTGGHKENPTYKDTCTGTTGHAEAVKIQFDPKVVSYQRLLDIFWHSQYRHTSGTLLHVEIWNASLTLVRQRISFSSFSSAEHDPTTKDRQGGDIGSQYRSALFYHSDAQKQLAEAGVASETARLGKTVVTEVVPAGKWWPAEEYHQKYLEKGGQCALKGDKTAIRCYG